MSAPWKTVRVFISSTFRDMHAERDYLVHDVFLELKERCARRQLHLIDVDLRWGVTEEEERQGRVLEICLDEIERCRPFFIGLLGERYGWTPPRYDVRDDEKYKWVKELETRESGHSVTALEIYHGVLRNPSMQTRAFFYFRDPSFLQDPRFLEEVPAAKQGDFLPESEAAASKLKALKDEIKEHCPVFENYPCKYAGLDEKGQVKLTGLDDFGKRLLEEVWEAIKLEHPEGATRPDELAIERSYHDAFIEGRAQRFIGRTDVLAQLTAFADGQTENTLVVTGKAGCGKSAVLANFVRDYAAKHPEEFVLAHFIGVSPGSTDIRRTLLRLCRELARQFNIQDEIPTDYYELRQTFVKFLEHATTQGKVLLVLDAVNQLDESHYAHALDWLPQSLPGGLKIIASTIDDSDCLEALRRRSPAPREVVVGALTKAERKEIVRQTLEVYRKHLDEKPENDQMGLLLSKSESDNPLYLTVACEEMRVFGEFERVTERIGALPGGVESLFEQALERIEDDHEKVEPNKGKERVKTALSLLECSRHGLLESEMLELLARDGEEHLPQAIWARLYRSLSFYLRPPGEDGEGALDFFHPQLSKAVREKYLAGEGEEIAIHRRLAELFHRKADPDSQEQFSGNYPRGLSELPHHQLEGRLYDELFRVARNEAFLRTQAREFPRDPSLPNETIQAAIKGAARCDNAGTIAEFLLAHAKRVMAIRSESPLDALRAGQLERAWELADLHDIENCSLWHLLLAWEMKDAGRKEDARATLRRLAQEKLVPLRPSWESNIAAAMLVQALETDEDAFAALRLQLVKDDYNRDFLSKHLAKRHHFAIASEIARSIVGKTTQSIALSKLVTAQEQAGEAEAAGITLAQALASAQRIEDPSDRLGGIAAVQAQAGQLTEALATAQRIEDQLYRSIALSKISAAQAQIGLFVEARATAQQIDDPFADSGPIALAGIVAAQAKTGQFREALASAQQIENQQHRSVALGEIAAAQAQGGEAGEARTTFGQALDTALLVENKWDRSNALIGIAAARAQAGQLTEALATAQQIEDERYRSNAWIGIAAARAQAGEFMEALAVAQRIEYHMDRSKALGEIAAAQVQAEEPDDARATFARALTTAQRNRDQWDRSKVLREIATAQAQAGEAEEARTTFAQARAIALQMQNQGDRSNALREIAAAQATAGQFKEALATAQQIEDEGHRSNAWIGIAAGQAQAGQFLEALATAQRIASRYRPQALIGIAAAQSKAGQAEGARATFAQALATAQEIGKHRDRSQALSKIAAAQAQAGESEKARTTIAQALATAQQVTDQWDGSNALHEIATAQAQVGEAEAAQATFAQAVATALEIESQWPQERTLISIAAAQLQAGQLAEAVGTAQRIANQLSRANTLSEIAAAQAQAGEAEEGETTFRQAIVAAQGLEDQGSRSLALHNIAAAQAQAGQLTEALATARQIENKLEYSVTLRKIATAQEQAGNSEEARVTFVQAIASAQGLEKEGHRLSVLCEIATAQAQAGEAKEARATLAQALAVAQRMEDQHDRSYGLSNTAAVLIETGFGEQGWRIAEMILTERDSRLPGIAEALAKVGDRENFKHLLIPCAYYLNASYRMCGLLTHVYPGQATAVAAIVSAESD